MSLQQFTGVGVLTMHNDKPIIITAGDLDTIKAYLGEQDTEGDPEICQVSITVGPRADFIPPIPKLLHATRFAEMLGEREIGKELTKEEEKQAKEHGLVVVFGYSDDCTELRGAICDEVGLGAIRLTKTGKLIEGERMDALTELVEEGVLSKDDLPKFGVIVARFTDHHHYDTDIPHARFTVMEDGERFCEGIVFHINDITTN